MVTPPVIVIIDADLVVEVAEVATTGVEVVVKDWLDAGAEAVFEVGFAELENKGVVVVTVPWDVDDVVLVALVVVAPEVSEDVAAEAV